MRNFQVKCRFCHGYGHFARSCKKFFEEEVVKEKGDEWIQVQKNKSTKQRNKEKKQKGELGTSNNTSGQKEHGEVMKESMTQNNFEVLSIPKDQTLKEGEVPQTQIQTSEEDKGYESEINTPVEGHSPTYAEMEKKKKPTDNSGSSDENTLERSSKKGRKSHKMVREEEVERLKMQGNQPTIEMSISRNTRARPLKGGPPPSVK